MFCLEFPLSLGSLSRHELLCRDRVQLPVVMALVATTFSSLQVFVSQPQFHVATWLSCPLLSSVSRPHFNVAIPFLLQATLIPGHNFPFVLRHHLFVFCLYSSCDSKLLIYFSSLSRHKIYVATRSFLSLLYFFSQPKRQVVT